MPKRTRSFRSWQLEKLADPKRAASYLNACLKDSTEQFLIALGKVAQAHQMSKVALDAGQRETLYRSFSGQGNPTLGTLDAVLKAVGLRISIATSEVTEYSSPSIGSLSVPASAQGGIKTDGKAGKIIPGPTAAAKPSPRKA